VKLEARKVEEEVSFSRDFRVFNFFAEGAQAIEAGFAFSVY
jgi:hypothetical protein